MEFMQFEYKGIPVTIEEPGEGVTYTPSKVAFGNGVDSRVTKELGYMIAYIVVNHAIDGRVPTVDEAKRFSALSCFNGTRLEGRSVEDIAREVGVTPEFAQYRLDLELPKDKD